jgi:hypothetical protein
MNEMKYTSKDSVIWNNPWKMECKLLINSCFLFYSTIKKDVVQLELRLLYSAKRKSTHLSKKAVKASNNYAKIDIFRKYIKSILRF